MQKSCKKDCIISFAHSVAPSVLTFPSSWTSSELQIQQSSLSNKLSLKMATTHPHCQIDKNLHFNVQEQDSSSTQSTGESYSEVASVGENNCYGQSIISTQSVYNGIHGKPEVGHMKPAFSVGSQDYLLPSQVERTEPFDCVPRAYTDLQHGGFLTYYGAQTMINHPEMMGMTSRRVPLPLDLPQNEPIYVNAKQYHAILRRRRFRAKLEAQSRLSKVRKPYLHESRHLHALKRVRGSGGRFLNMKKIQESKPTSKTHGQVISGKGLLRMTTDMSQSNVHQPENYKDSNSASSCSEITSASDNGIFDQQEFRISLYPSRIGRAPQSGGGNMYDGNQQYLSVLQ